MKGDKSAESSPEHYLKLITPDSLKIHLTELAGDKYEGRYENLARISWFALMVLVEVANR